MTATCKSSRLNTRKGTEVQAQKKLENFQRKQPKSTTIKPRQKRTLQNESEVKSDEALRTHNSETIKRTLSRSRIPVKRHNTRRRLKLVM